MRILVACEYSGVVRDAFIRHGHDAISCDLLPSDSDFGPHYQGDVFDIIQDGFDLMIAHPPCTYLCSSGLHWNKRRPERAELTEAAITFVKRLWDAPIRKVAIENPIGCLSTRFAPPTQIIQPWQFGHAESKATCLWLRGVSALTPTNILPKPVSGRWDNQTATGQNRLTPSADRWKLRSKTYQGIADAMAEQWGSIEPKDGE